MFDFDLNKIYYIINILLSISFLLFSWLIKKIIGFWLNPPSIFFILWFVYTLLPLIMASEAIVTPWVIIYILSACIFYALPYGFINWKSAVLKNKLKINSHEIFYNKKTIIILYILSFTGVLTNIIFTLQQGLSLKEIIFDTLSVSSQFASMRYASEIESSFISRLGLQLSYYTVIIGGLVYGSRGKKNNGQLTLLLSFSPSLIVMILQSAKGLFVFSVFLFIASVLVTRIYDKKLSLISLSGANKMITYGTIAVSLLILSFVTRGINDENNNDIVLNTLKFYIVTYSSVHLPAFSDWFSERYFDLSIFNYKQEVLQLGFYTFMPLYRIFGDDRIIPMGTYDEFYNFQDIMSGNLYTIFRGLITDFGLFGSLILMFIFGYISSIMFKRLLDQKKSALSIVFFIYLIGFLYQTYLVSTLMWMTIWVAIFVQWLILYLLLSYNLKLIKIKKNE